jgi:hypothetical protein
MARRAHAACCARHAVCVCHRRECTRRRMMLNSVQKNRIWHTHTHTHTHTLSLCGNPAPPVLACISYRTHAAWCAGQLTTPRGLRAHRLHVWPMHKQNDDRSSWDCSRTGDDAHGSGFWLAILICTPRTLIGGWRRPPPVAVAASAPMAGFARGGITARAMTVVVSAAASAAPPPCCRVSARRFSNFERYWSEGLPR